MNNAATFNVAKGNNIFPQNDIYVDTNAWIDIALNRSGGQATSNYLIQFVSQSPNNYLLWSSHTSDEIKQTLQVDEYAKEAKLRNITRYKKTPAYKRLENTISDQDAIIIAKRFTIRFENLKMAFDGSVYEIENIDITQTTDKIVRVYGIPFKDAKHLAYMYHEENNNIFTDDKRFIRVPGLNIYSTCISTNGNPVFPFSEFMPDIK